MKESNLRHRAYQAMYVCCAGCGAVYPEVSTSPNGLSSPIFQRSLARAAEK